MEEKIPLKEMKETFEDKSIVSFLDDAYGISNSVGTKQQYRHTLIAFNRFCLTKYGKDFVTLVSGLKGRPIEEVLEVFKDFKRHMDVKINQFGKKIWKHRARDSRAVPGSLRYQVLKKAKHRCELCGIPADEKALDVDHILPVNKGGKTVIENLQALCYTCNSQKRDLDDTDFRPWKRLYDSKKSTCPFCKLEKTSKDSTTLAFVIKDKYPVTEGHVLICPKRHVSSFFELGTAEHKACLELLAKLKDKISKNDKKVTSFNIGINDGIEAGQTISHCHIHLIPRRKGDVKDPRGGIRNTIPGKGDY